jgi:hypothetical protein
MSHKRSDSARNLAVPEAEKLGIIFAERVGG